MSVVAVRIYHSKIIMVADSIVLTNEYIRLNENFQSDKIWTDNDFVWGCCGDGCSINWFKYYTSTNALELPEDSSLISDEVVFDVIPTYFTKFKNYIKEKYDYEIDSENNSFAVAVANQDGVVIISSDASTQVINNFFDFGVNKGFCISAFEMGATPLEAAKIYLKYNALTEYPIKKYEIDKETNEILYSVYTKDTIDAGIEKEKESIMINTKD